MKIIRVGIATQEEIQKRTVDIAAGRIKPKSTDPKIWFTSLRSVGALLSDENRGVLRVISTSKPDSITHLAEITGIKQQRLSRILKSMSVYGFVELKRLGQGTQPIAKVSKFIIELR